jgi:hypothetical protein
VPPRSVPWPATEIDVTRSSSLVRAHAPSQNPPVASVCRLVPRVLAGCCGPLLGVGPSRRSLLTLSLGAWPRTPPRCCGALARFFPDTIGLTSVSTGSARRNLHHNSTFSDGHRFRGCSHSLMFRRPYLRGLQGAPTATALSQAIGQPGRLHHAKTVWLPSTHCGIAPYPTRAIDMAGLAPARLRPCRPLHQTPVVSCPLALSHPGLLPAGHCTPSAFPRYSIEDDPIDHDSTYFGAPSRSLPPRSIQLRTPITGCARGLHS